MHAQQGIRQSKTRGPIDGLNAQQSVSRFRPPPELMGLAPYKELAFYPSRVAGPNSAELRVAVLAKRMPLGANCSQRKQVMKLR